MAGQQFTISRWFWNPDIWLPPNVTWESFEIEVTLHNCYLQSSDNFITVEQEEDTVLQSGKFAQFSHLAYPLPMAGLVIAVRWLVEHAFRRLGRHLGMRERARTRPQQCVVLESAYRVSGNPGEEEVRTLAQQTDRSPSQVGFIVTMSHRHNI